MLDLSDPATLKNESRVNSEDDKRLLLKPGVHPSEGFPRDWCALCENVFFAYEGGPKGLEINGGLVEILQRAQRRDDVDRYGVFGYQGTGQRRRANGKRGIGLQLGGNDADAVIAWIRGSAGSIVKDR